MGKYSKWPPNHQPETDFECDGSFWGQIDQDLDQVVIPVVSHIDDVMSISCQSNGQMHIGNGRYPEKIALFIKWGFPHFLGGYP